MKWKTLWTWAMVGILACSLVIATHAAHAVVAPVVPIAPGHYKIAWQLDPLTINGVQFIYLQLEGTITDSQFSEFSGLFQTKDGGAYAVHASCYKNSIGGLFCTTYCPDKNRWLSVSHDGAAELTDLDFATDYRSLTKL